MVTRDPEAKHASLLEAGLIEFAARGFAGTTVDAIADRAGCSTGLIYTYFCSKEGLFDAVRDHIAERTLTDIPLTPADLPGYAARIYDAGLAHPKLLRFARWYQLERGPILRTRFGRRAAAIRAAQREGILPDHLDAPILLAGVQAIAQMWANHPDAADEHEAAHRRNAIITLVRQLVSPADPQP